MELDRLFTMEALSAASEGDARAVAKLASAPDPATAAKITRGLTDHFAEFNIPLAAGTRALLATKLAAGGVDAMSEADAERVRFLLTGIDLHDVLDEMDRSLKSYLYPKMAESARFGEAQAQWDSWDIGRKLDYGRHFARQFSRITGMPMADIEAIDVAPDKPGGDTVYGLCTPPRAGQRQCTVGLNAHDGAAFKSMQIFDETIYHELMHTIHMHLAVCARQGRFDEVDRRLREPAALLGLMMHKRFAAGFASFADYENYPSEKHAENSARDYSATMHDDAKRTAMLESYHRNMETSGFKIRPASAGPKAR